MKKAIVIICVLSVLALMVVPVLAGVLFAEGDLDRLMAPRTPGTTRGAEAESPTQIAPMGWAGRPQG
jgi:hypothetical protein